MELYQREPEWWWKGLWKIKCPQKAKIFMWCALKNKVPTWDRMYKRQIEGPRWCPLRRVDVESIFHLLVQCQFTDEIWKEASSAVHIACVSVGNSVEAAWQSWLQRRDHTKIKSLPLLISWGAWLARNADIFKDRPSLPEIIAGRALSILSHFPQKKACPAIRIVCVEQIDQSKPWAFSDDASQNDNQICGGGVVLFLNSHHSFHIKMGLGGGTNNFAKLALKLLLFAREKEIRSIQIFGDRLNVINWCKKYQQCNNILLQPILEEIFRYLTFFDSYEINHVYKERNIEADSLSKSGL